MRSESGIFSTCSTFLTIREGRRVVDGFVSILSLAKLYLPPQSRQHYRRLRLR